MLEDVIVRLGGEEERRGMLDAKLGDLRGMCVWVEREVRAEEEATGRVRCRGREEGARSPRTIIGDDCANVNGT